MAASVGGGATLCIGDTICLSSEAYGGLLAGDGCVPASTPAQQPAQARQDKVQGRGGGVRSHRSFEAFLHPTAKSGVEGALSAMSWAADPTRGVFADAAFVVRPALQYSASGRLEDALSGEDHPGAHMDELRLNAESEIRQNDVESERLLGVHASCRAPVVFSPLPAGPPCTCMSPPSLLYIGTAQGHPLCTAKCSSFSMSRRVCGSAPTPDG